MFIHTYTYIQCGTHEQTHRLRCHIRKLVFQTMFLEQFVTDIDVANDFE